MGKMDKTISLLPFIESDGDGFLLDIPVVDQGRTILHGHSYPFQIADQGQNFSILVKAGLKVNHSDPFKALFLLIQRDHYPLSPDELTPFTNAGIDKIWQDTIVSYSTTKTVFCVPEQLTREGQITPFRSLFYCKKEEIFFHPPCPECGGALELCRDDDLLITAALFPYSTSLKRYLFCPECSAAKGRSEFYQFSRSGEDSVFVNDRFDLIKRFGKLRTITSGVFPCLDCPGHAECYITGEKAVSHISFLSFYPFHMLFFDAEPIKAVDFLPLISGAGFEEKNISTPTATQSNREKMLDSLTGSPFFFKDDERFFLEVLFLKLSFFEKITQTLFKRIEKNNYSQVNISVQSLWIRPQAPGSILPFFWDFNVHTIDLITNSSKNYIESVLTKNRSLQFIACLWFYTFLVNKNQGPAEVYGTIGKLAEKELEAPFPIDYDNLVTAFSSVTMENIFWNPESGKVPQKWHGYWMKIISTGLGFFTTIKEQGLKHHLEELLDTIENLKQDVKTQLFSKVVQAAPEVHKPTSTSNEIKIEADPEQPASKAEKQEISLILKTLRSKWAVPDEIPPDVDDDVLETIVLSSPDLEQNTESDDGAEKNVTSPPPVAEQSLENGFDNLDETIIVSSVKKPQEASDFDDINEKTVILTGPEAGQGEFDDMEETIIMSPVKNLQEASGFDDTNKKTVILTGPEAGQGEFDDMDETVIMSPNEKPQEESGFFDNDDDLDKTIVINPKK